MTIVSMNSTPTARRLQTRGSIEEHERAMTSQGQVQPSVHVDERFTSQLPYWSFHSPPPPPYTVAPDCWIPLAWPQSQCLSPRSSDFFSQGAPWMTYNAPRPDMSTSYFTFPPSYSPKYTRDPVGPRVYNSAPHHDPSFAPVTTSLDHQPQWRPHYQHKWELQQQLQQQQQQHQQLQQHRRAQHSIPNSKRPHQQSLSKQHQCRATSKSPPHGGIPSNLRGPPLKPRHSEHALWVGNLPPDTNVYSVKDHFSQNLTQDIESVFLISKSCCAFINYKNDSALTRAMTQFHETEFCGARLVCRARRKLQERLQYDMTAANLLGREGPMKPDDIIYASQTAQQAIARNRQAAAQALAKSGKIQDRYFALKSLTVEDIMTSVRDSIWTTQSHNEKALNEAYNSCANVFLIFSANKYGEYFGFARMASAIVTKPVEQDQIQQAPESSTDFPTATITEPTRFAPKGHVIDDSARGSIFWEAESSPSEKTTCGESSDIRGMEDGSSSDASSPVRQVISHGISTLGHQFRVEWQNTTHLPFTKTRGLVNAWNANREIKVARDGIELETGVGQRLIQLFNDQPPSNKQ